MAESEAPNHPLLPPDFKPIEGVEPYKGWYYLWKYVPSIPAAGVLAGLFLIVTVLVTWKAWKSRTWYCIILSVGGLFEVIGYISRIICHNNTAEILPFSMQIIAILLAPVLFAASIYMTLGRMILALGRYTDGAAESHAIIRPRWLTRLFVAGDVTALSIQGTASGLMIMVDHVQTGTNLVVAGLAFHIVVFGLFWTTAGLFHRRAKRDPTMLAVPQALRWEQTFFMLYGCSALIMARSVFRMVEFIMGEDGYLLSVEWPLYVFDAVPMWIVMVIFWWWFPSGLLSQELSISAEGDDGPSSSAVELAPGKRMS